MKKSKDLEEIRRKIHVLRDILSYYREESRNKILAEVLEEFLGIMESSKNGIPGNISLDEFQEIVNFIKANKSKFDNLSMPNISGLADALAEKVNANAEGLTPEHITKWKEKLGVGEFPSNIATIDEGAKQGNTYTKEKVDELLSGSAGGNGKNLANADLQIPAGTVRTLDVTGAKFQIRGLKDKDADSSFNKRVVLNENGEFALKDSADIKVIIPENTTVNINHQYPNVLPSNIPEGVERIREFIKNLKTSQFTKLTEEDFSINIDETLKNNFRKKGSGIQYLERSPLPNNSPYLNASQITGGVSTVSIRAFPTNKKWCLKVPVENTIAIWKEHQGKNQIGLVRNHHDDIGLSFLTGVMVQFDNGKKYSLMTLLRDTKQFVKTPDSIVNHGIYAIFYCDGQGLIYASYVNATGTYLTEIIGVSDVDEVRLAGALSYTFVTYPQFLEFGKNTEYYIEP